MHSDRRHSIRHPNCPSLVTLLSSSSRSMACSFPYFVLGDKTISDPRILIVSDLGVRVMANAAGPAALIPYLVALLEQVAALAVDLLWPTHQYLPFLSRSNITWKPDVYHLVAGAVRLVAYFNYFAAPLTPARNTLQRERKISCRFMDR